MKYRQKLPIKVEKQLDSYIERIKKIQWFKFDPNLEIPKVEKQIKLSLKAFGVEAKIEYRDLRTPGDWAAAWDGAWAAARDAARAAAWEAAWDGAWAAARDAAWAAADLLVLNLPNYKKKYPKGNFINLISLWEMGLYPVGIVNGIFIVYVPTK